MADLFPRWSLKPFDPAVGGLGQLGDCVVPSVGLEPTTS